MSHPPTSPLEYIAAYIEDFLICSLCYMVAVGMIYSLVFLLGSAVLAPLPPGKPDAYRQRVGKLALFLILLLFVGDLFGCVWGDLIWGRFYRSTDYFGIDFLPFIPITRWFVIDRPFGSEVGGLIGVTLFQLNAIWFVFAVGTWGSTIALYRRIRKKPEPPYESLLQPVLSP